MFRRDPDIPVHTTGPHGRWIDAARRQFEQARQRLAKAASSSADGGTVSPVRPPCPPGYEILEPIHRGGQGVVYKAVQRSTGRSVAVKVMRAGPLASPQDRPRFEREAHVLARLNHPHIVTILDCGVTEGHSYLVMDWLAGRPLDAYLSSGPRPLRDTLALFAQICEAVNAAHLRGVIHRDLKPGNILVDAQGQAHILDFGLAKLEPADAAAGSSEQTMTVTGQFLGSTPWASPEQAEGRSDQIDLRSDVYSLGVILYQMLTGRFPYRVVGTVRAVLNTIVSAEPTRPRVHRPELGDDVQTIVLKCLAKQPERRYQSAGDLARDIRRYLAGEPIEAKRDSTWYVLRKSLRRHRVATAVVCGFLLLSAGSAAALSVLYGRAEAQRVAAVEAKGVAERLRAAEGEQRRQAQQAAAEAEAVSGFLEEMLAAADPRGRGKDVTVREVLDEAAQTIEARLADQPLVEARLRATIGQTYAALGLYESAEPHLVGALEIRRHALGDVHQDTLVSQNALGMLHWRLGRHAQAMALFEEVVRKSERALGRDHLICQASLANLGLAYSEQGRHAEAEKLLQEAVSTGRRVLGDEDPQVPLVMGTLATIYESMGRFAESERLRRELIELGQRVWGEEDPRTLTELNNLAVAYYNQRRFEQAEPLLVRVLELQKRVLGETHPTTLSTLQNLATVHTAQGRHAEAEPLLAEVLQARLRLLGEQHPDTVTSMHELGALYEAQGRHGEAETVYSQALELWLRLVGERHPNTLLTMNNLAGIYMKQKRYEPAEALLARAAEIGLTLLPEGHWHRGALLARHGSCLTKLGRYEEAEARLLRGYEEMVQALGTEDPRAAKVIDLLVDLYQTWDREEDTRSPAQRSPAHANQ